jgi:hypothetical protein
LFGVLPGPSADHVDLVGSKQNRSPADRHVGDANEAEVLLPAEAARRLVVATRNVIKAMYERRLRCVRLDDGTLVIPAHALVGFDAEAG